MPLSGGGNRWTDHVRAFADSKGISYMCAMSDPQCSATYKGVKPAKAPKAPKAKKAKKQTKKEERENITMSMEDKPAPARGERLEDIFESATPFEEFNSPTVRAILKNKGSLNKVLDKKITEQQGMLAEDINRAVPKPRKQGRPKGSLNKVLNQKLADQQGMLAEDINRAVPKGRPRSNTLPTDETLERERRGMSAEDKNVLPKKKSGRPAKYANPEEARQAKIANTIRRAKERVDEKKDAKMSAKIAKAKELYKNLLYNLRSWYGNNVDLSNPKWYEEHPHAIKTHDEYVEKILKKVKGVKKEDFVGGGFNVGMPKTGGMLGWVQSVLGRHPKLTREQREQAERFADELMADPRGITFEGASVIPIEVRKELAQELYNRQTMSREDKDAPANPAEAFADEIRKQYEAQKKKGKGRMSGGFGFNDFVQGLNKLNPVMWGIQNHPEVGIKLGKVTNDNLLPAVVAVGKPVYDAVAVAVGTELTGNPALGKIAGDQFWNTYGRPYDPQSRQDNEALKQISEKLGDKAGRKATEINRGRGRPKGGATTLQKGLSAEMRSYIAPPLQHDLNQIIHSNDAPHTKFGMTPNAYRDFTNQFDPKAQKQIDRAIQVLIKNGILPAPVITPLKASAPVFTPTGKGLLGSDPATYTPDLRPRLGADPRTYTPAYLSQGGGPPIFTADWRGPEVQAERRRLTEEYYKNQKNGGSIDPRDFAQAIHIIKAIKKIKGGLYGGAEPSEANTPDDYYAVEPEYPDEEDDGMGGIDWGAIGQALMDDALEGQPPYQGEKNAEEP